MASIKVEGECGAALQAAVEQIPTLSA